MDEDRSVVIYDIIGSPWAICDEDARRVSDCLLLALSRGEGVQLSFLHIELLSFTFVNHLVSILLSHYSAEALQDQVQLKYAHKAFFSLYQERLRGFS